MKVYSAHLKYISGSTYKFSLIADLIRNKDILFATNALKYSVKSGAKVLLKLLNSCIANANNAGADSGNLFLKSVEVGKAFTLKRITPRGRGRMSRIEKRYTKLTITLAEKIFLENKKTIKKK